MENKKDYNTVQYGFNIPVRFSVLKRLAYPFVNLFYHLLISTVPHIKRKCRYEISLILIFKDEAPYLREWLEYHLILGVEHFYLYQNNSSDNYLQVITPYIERGLITLVDWPDYPGQYSAYFNWYQTYRQETRWAAFIDADEFLCPIKEKTLTDALKQYCNYPAVLVYWKHFGTSGLLRHDSNKLVIEQYIACYPELMSEGKVFYNTRFDAATRFISMHELKTRWKGFVIPPVNTFYKFVIWNLHQIGKNSNAVIQLNHYWSKAYECWEKKYEKGSIEKGVRYKDFSFFELLETECTSSDYTIYRFLILLKLRLLNNSSEFCSKSV